MKLTTIAILLIVALSTKTILQSSEGKWHNLNGSTTWEKGVAVKAQPKASSIFDDFQTILNSREKHRRHSGPPATARWSRKSQYSLDSDLMPAKPLKKTPSAESLETTKVSTSFVFRKLSPSVFASGPNQGTSIQKPSREKLEEAQQAFLKSTTKNSVTNIKDIDVEPNDPTRI